jgi:hypothetical protein
MTSIYQVFLNGTAFMGMLKKRPDGVYGPEYAPDSYADFVLASDLAALESFCEGLKGVSNELRGKLAMCEKERDKLKQWVNDLQSGMYINCVYCGYRYGPDPGTPVAMAEVLKKHIEKCPKHPLSAMKVRAEVAEKERDENRLTISHLNRRCQEAESAAMQTVEKCKAAGISFARSLGNWYGAKLEREKKAAEARCKRLLIACQHVLAHGHIAPETEQIVREAMDD